MSAQFIPFDPPKPWISLRVCPAPTPSKSTQCTQGGGVWLTPLWGPPTCKGRLEWKLGWRGDRMRGLSGKQVREHHFALLGEGGGGKEVTDFGSKQAEAPTHTHSLSPSSTWGGAMNVPGSLGQNRLPFICISRDKAPVQKSGLSPDPSILLSRPTPLLLKL